jgi:hypothetical protein
MDTQNIPRIAASLDEELLSTRPSEATHHDNGVDPVKDIEFVGIILAYTCN